MISKVTVNCLKSGTDFPKSQRDTGRRGACGAPNSQRESRQGMLVLRGAPPAVSPHELRRLCSGKLGLCHGESTSIKHLCFFIIWIKHDQTWSNHIKPWFWNSFFMVWYSNPLVSYEISNHIQTISILWIFSLVLQLFFMLWSRLWYGFFHIQLHSRWFFHMKPAGDVQPPILWSLISNASYGDRQTTGLPGDRLGDSTR